MSAGNGSQRNPGYRRNHLCRVEGERGSRCAQSPSSRCSHCLEYYVLGSQRHPSPVQEEKERITDITATDVEATNIRKISLQWSPKNPAYRINLERLRQPVIKLIIIYTSLSLPCCNFFNPKITHIKKKKIPKHLVLHNVGKKKVQGTENKRSSSLDSQEYNDR